MPFFADRGQQRQIGFGGTDFALFQPFGNGIQDGDGGQYQDGGCTKQVFRQAFHSVSLLRGRFVTVQAV